MEMRYVQPGKKPLSKNPSRNRIACSPPFVFTKPCPIVMIPQQNMIPESHVDGAMRLMMMLLGTSKRIYGTKKMKSATL